MNHARPSNPRVLCGLFLLLLVSAIPGQTLRADPPRVFPAGQASHDARLGELKTLDGYFPFTPPATKEAWTHRAERVRRQLLVATGLWPMPTKTPASAVVHGKIDRDGYTIEKVYLESFPGHFVTGNLYRPTGRTGKLPGVLCPHGHWANGRFYDAGAKKIREEIVIGAERFDPAGRYPLQARCVQLARMGCVVFHYDMVGYADSVQLAHSPKFRPEMNTPENWGYFSPQAETRMQNMMGLQTYNSIRALDWFSGLDDVDPRRIAVTGASGGGTQTFILSAVDPRPAVAFPAVMVSTAMQGGCTCENACYLRVGMGNIEIAALTAPRPLGMTAADDWTKEIATKGLPELKQLYRLLGVESLVMAKPLLHFPHNYNYVSREVMYHWMNKQLKLGLEEPIVEEDFRPVPPAELSVWDDQHPKPHAGPGYERSLLRWITDDSQRQMAGLLPTDEPSLKRYREVVGGAVDVLIGRGLPETGVIQAAERRDADRGDFILSTLLLRNPAEGEEIPAILLRPKTAGEKAAVWIDRQGKQGLFDKDDQPKPAILKLLAAGVTVIGVDLLGQGEATADGHPLEHARLVKPDYAGYTYGYNSPLFSKRVHDILSAIAFVRGGETPAKQVLLVGLNRAGHWVAAARAQASGAVDRAVIDTAGFRFAQAAALDDPDFLPGGAKYLDLPGMLALSAPQELWLSGEAAELPVVTAAYKAAGHADQVQIAVQSASADQAVDWLLR